MLDTYEIVVTAFSITDKANRVRFSEETFLVANINPKIVFWMLFLISSSEKVDFPNRELWWRTYTTNKVFLTIRRIELVRKKEFAAVKLNPEYKTFVVYVTSFNSSLFVVFLSSTLLNANVY